MNSTSRHYNTGHMSSLVLVTCYMLSLVFGVSPQDERAIYASTEGLSVHYAQYSMNPEVRCRMSVM